MNYEVVNEICKLIILIGLKLFEKIGLTGIREKEIKKFIIIFYIVGLTGMLIPFTFKFFKIITPLALIVNFVILTAYHKGSLDKKTIFTFSGIYLLGFFVEVLGVKSGIIFGSYAYGKTLGLKIFETPLIIGLNWLFLCYVANTIIDRFNLNIILKIFAASLLMLIYDTILEQVAPLLDFWYWKNNQVPLQNYIAWFFTACIFNSAINLLKISTKNSMSGIIFISQFLFFLLLYIFYILI